MSAVVVLHLLTACATDPRALCDAVVGHRLWTPVAAAPPGADEVEAQLPSVPYRTNSGHQVRHIRRLWYEGAHGYLACTIERGAKDSCSVIASALQQQDARWIVSEPSATPLCNILLGTGGT